MTHQINSDILIVFMSNFDYLDLDGHALALLLAVYEEGSVTRAAQRLGITQSAVSHGLVKLRAIVGDALFVKSGRGIAATARADRLAARAAQLLGDLRGFSHLAGFDPAQLVHSFTVAANDLQRDALAGAVLRRLRAQAPGVSLRLIDSGAPTAALLREQRADLLITPRPPEGEDIFQQRLFADHYRVFFDAAERQAPRSRADYLAAEHVSVLYEPRRSLFVDEWLLERGARRSFVALVPSMAALAGLLRGSPWLATAPSLLARGALRDLAHAAPPLALPPMPMYLVWHRRHQIDPVHQWLRGHVLAVARTLSQPDEATGGS
jgi:DNA-binding transcriptional LysR family regulator